MQICLCVDMREGESAVEKGINLVCRGVYMCNYKIFTAIESWGNIFRENLTKGNLWPFRHHSKRIVRTMRIKHRAQRLFWLAVNQVWLQSWCLRILLNCMYNTEKYSAVKLFASIFKAYDKALQLLWLKSSPGSETTKTAKTAIFLPHLRRQVTWRSMPLVK